MASCNLEDLRICFLAGTLGQGGAERQLFYMLAALQASGSSLSVLSLTQGEYWESRIREMGIPVIWVGGHSSQALRLQRIVSETRRIKPTILQSCHCFTNAYVAVAARLAGTREVGAIRSDTRQTISGKFAAIRLWSLRHLRAIAVNSRASLLSALEFGVNRNRLYLLSNVVNVDQFFPDRRRRDGGVVRVLAAGRFTAEKRFDRLLRVVAALPEEVLTHVQVGLAGDGPLRGALEREARQLGLRDSVRFLGAQSDMAPIYREFDILALTSESEGSPNVVLEAMASGLPVVATRAGGVSELVENEETGLLADLDDEAGLATALSTLIVNAELRDRMGARARHRILRDHSPATLPGSLSSLYSMALL